MSTLLVPVDFSPVTPEVLRHASRLARALDAGLRLLHVVELPAGLTPETTIRPDGSEDEVSVGQFLAGSSDTALDALVDQVRQQGAQVRGEVRWGPVVDTLLAAAAEDGVEMVIMGTHGRQGLARVLMGSVAEQVTRRSPVPVLSVRVPLDAWEGSASADEALVDAESEG